RGCLVQGRRGLRLVPGTDLLLSQAGQEPRGPEVDCLTAVFFDGKLEFDHRCLPPGSRRLTSLVCGTITDIVPGAQTERRGGAGPAGACLAVRTPPAASSSTTQNGAD